MMTKPLAILKDSLREAWDSKTLLVMLILVGLFLIGVASIGYQSAAPREVIDGYAKTLSAPILRLQRGKYQGTLIDRSTGRPYAYPECTVTTFKTLKEGGHESTGEQQFTLLFKDAEIPGEGGEPGDQKGADKKEVAPKEAAEPKAGTESQMPIFEKYVAAWPDTDGDLVRLDDRKQMDPRKWRVVRPVTDEMVKEFLAAELEKSSTLPMTGFERLPDPAPGERLYKITTGPSAEPRLWPVKFSVLFGAWETPGAAPLGDVLFTIQDYVISWIGGLTIMLIAVIVTSFFIPNMLRPGSVVMLLSKPISRSTLLLFKYFGGLFFVLILASVMVGGVWLITGIRAGVWTPGVFMVIPLMTLSFAILYAISTVTAVWSRNAIVCILVTLACAGAFWGVGRAEWFSRQHRQGRDDMAALLKEEPKYDRWATVAVTVNSVLPRWHDIDRLTGEVVSNALMTPEQQEARGTASAKKHLPSWGGTLGVTALWIAALLGLACWRFSTKDY
jgi:ABC-type transport system involved in multi-copper enzyme maturation permease subunit